MFDNFRKNKAYQVDFIMERLMAPLSLGLGVITGLLFGPLAGIVTFLSTLVLIVIGGINGWYSYQNVNKILDRLELIIEWYQHTRRRFSDRKDVYEATNGWREGQWVQIKSWPVRTAMGGITRKRLDAKFVGLTDRETAVFELDYPVDGSAVIELDGRQFATHSPRNKDAEREEARIREARLKEEAMNSFATTRLREFNSIMDGTDDELERITQGTPTNRLRA